MSYLDQGGNIYIEGVDLGQDLNGTDLFDYLGLCYEYTGGDFEVTKLVGSGALMTDMNFDYLGGPDPHYSVDNLCRNNSVTMFECENGIGRMFVVDKGNYKAITSSVILGAFANGSDLSIKPYLISEIVNYFLDLTVITSVDELDAGIVSDISNYPNPFSDFTNITYFVKNETHVTIEVFNQSGQLVKELVNKVQAPGQYTVRWDGDDLSGTQVAGNVYFYRFKANNQTVTRKLVRVR